MTNIVNLRMARKRKSRNEREVRAEQNRALHSIPKRERDLKEARLQLEKSRLDGHARDITKKDK
ncbi:MAG: hypothetical protein COB78_02440 [Hyphomicrobiales bacterium]|nr:MAG: hypothetical protein COB78_02440 [Hyphomicrobiales bacterium]